MMQAWRGSRDGATIALCTYTYIRDYMLYIYTCMHMSLHTYVHTFREQRFSACEYAQLFLKHAFVTRRRLLYTYTTKILQQVLLCMLNLTKLTTEGLLYYNISYDWQCWNRPRGASWNPGCQAVFQLWLFHCNWNHFIVLHCTVFETILL